MCDEIVKIVEAGQQGKQFFVAAAGRKICSGSGISERMVEIVADRCAGERLIKE